jgi:hypothetical protein
MSDHIDELVTMLQQDSPFRDGTLSYKSWRNERDNAAVELATIAREADIQRKRADFFRDALDALHECPTGDDYPCKDAKGEPCPYLTDAGIPGYAACWDEVERRQR